MATFKNYAVNYTLSVNLSETAGLNTLLEQINVAENALKNFRSSISGIQKPFNDFARNIGRMHKSLNEMRNMGSLQITPTLNISSFDAQCKQLIVKAEQAAAVISGTFNSAFNVKPKGKGGGKVISIDDQIKALEKDIKSANAQLKALNPALMSKKDYETQKKNFGALISQKESDLKKLKDKSGQLAQNKLAQIPAIIVSNEETIASLNAVIGQLNKQIRPIVIPITVATNIDAAKGVKETVNGLKGVAKQAAGTAPVKAPKTSGTSAINKAKTYVSPTTKISSSAAGVLPFQKGIASLANTVQQEVRPIIRIDANILPALQKLAELVNAINRNKNHVINISAVGSIGGGAIGGANGASGGANGTTNITGITNTGNTGKAGRASGKSNGLSPYTNSLLEEFKPISDKIEAAKRAEEQAKKVRAKEAKSYKEWWQKVGGPTADANRALMMMGFSNPNAHPQATLKTKEAQRAFESAKRADYVKWWESALAQRDAAMDAERAISVMKLSNPNIHGPASPKTKEAQRLFEAKERAAQRADYVKWWEEQLKQQDKEQAQAKRAQEQTRRAQAYYQGGRSSSRTWRPSTWQRNQANRMQSSYPRYAPRKTSMNSFSYQLMGNTSLGARTPMFLDMMKGMGMMTGVGAAMSTMTETFSNASEYQNTMSTANAILRANYKGNNFDSDFKNMERIVRDVAKQTKFTAPQAADAARFMAMAGLSIPMINASIRPIADVAVIGDNDLGEVADKITNIQTAFKIKPQQMRSLADALTKTFTSSNTDMMMLAESMEYAAPMAHLAGAKVEDALAMIGIMGNAGIQGSMAGTTLRMMYQNVINPNKNQKLMWEHLGIKLKDENGNPRQLIEILGDLRKRVRITSDDKELGGEFKDEGTPIAEAVSRLFRVTASAGAGTLIENLDKVIQLAEANRNAGGLSESISLTKQNNVKGMWAKMTSAFTDAVVNEFEGSESPIKDYLSKITKYFGTSEFQDLLHDLFDVVQSLMSVLETFVKIWRKMYSIAGGLVKYVWAAQFFMAQIGYTLAPFASVFKTISRGIGATGLMMGGFGAAGMGGTGGMMSAGATGVMMGGGIRRAASRVGVTKTMSAAAPIMVGGAVTNAIRRPWANWQAVSSGVALSTMPYPIGYRNLQAERAVTTATGDPAINRRIQLYQRSRGYMTRGFTNTQRAQHNATIDRQVAALRFQSTSAQRRAMFNAGVPIMPYGMPLYFGNKTLTGHGRFTQPITRNLPLVAAQPFGKYSSSMHNVLYGATPQAKHYNEYAERAHKYLKASQTTKDAAKAAEYARKGNIYLNASRTVEDAYLASVIADRSRRKADIAAAATKRHTARKASAGLLARAAQMGKISKGKAIGMSLSSGFRTAATWAPTITMASMMGGFTRTVNFIGKMLGTLANPITYLTLAFAGLLTTVIAIGNRRKKQQEEFKKQDQVLKNNRDIVKGQLTNNVLEERARLGYGVMKLGKIDNDFSLSSIGASSTLPDGTKLAKNPLMRNLKGVSEIFRREGQSGYFNSALGHMSAFSRLMFGEDMSQRQIWEKFGYTVEDSVNSARPTKEFTKSAAIAAVMEASSHYVYADKLMQPIQRRLEEWTKIKDVKAAEEEWSKILADAKILAEQYNPKGKNLVSLQSYTSEQIGNMPFSQAFNTYEGQLALYDKLKSVEDPDHPLFGYFHALRKLRSDTQMNAQEIIDTVFKVSGGVQYELPDMNGQLKTVNQAFNEGKLKWEDFQANIQAFGLNVKDTLGAYHQIIYKTFLETRKIALEAGQVPPELEAFLKENGANIPQWYINTADDEELKKWRNDVRNRYTYDEKFRNEVDQQGGIEEFLDKNFGKTWFGKQRRPSTDLINGTVNSAIIRQNELSNQGNQGTTPPPVKPDKGKTSWGKWGSMFGNGQHAYINKYSNQSAMPSWTALNNHIEINIDGRNIDDERLGTLIGDKVVNAIGAIADRNSNNYMG